MDHLIKFLRAYQTGRTVDFRERMAEVIIEEVGPALLAYIERHCLREDVEDVSQETLMAIAENLEKFEVRDDSARLFWGWCYRIARRKVADAHRRRGKESQHTSLDDEAVGAEALWRAIEASEVDEPMSRGERLDLQEAIDLLKSLSPECFECLWKYHILGLPFVEIWESEELGYDTARRRIERCEAKARQLLKRKT